MYTMSIVHLIMLPYKIKQVVKRSVCPYSLTAPEMFAHTRPGQSKLLTGHNFVLLLYNIDIWSQGKAVAETLFTGPDARACPSLAPSLSLLDKGLC